MGRKVIKQGNGTLTITLPRKWTSQYHIEGGDELAVEQKGRDLIVSTKGLAKLDAAEISIPAPEHFLRRFLSVLYRKTVDEIRINFEDPAVLPLVEREVSDLLGFELVEQGRNYCILKNVAVAMESEFNTVIRRIFLMLKSSFEDVVTAIDKGSYEGLESVARAEKTNNKLVNFCQRTINKQGHLENHQLTSTFYVVSQLEAIADGLRDLAQAMQSCRPQLTKDVADIIKRTQKLFNDLYSLYYKFDRVVLVSMTKEEKKLVKEAQQLLMERKGPEALVLYQILLIMNLMHHTTEMI